MGKKPTKLGDQIRQAIDDADVSRYAICKATGIDEGSFSRFMAGKVGLTLANLEAVAELLDLRIVAGGNPCDIPVAKPGRPRNAAIAVESGRVATTTKLDRKPGRKPKGSVKP